MRELVEVHQNPRATKCEVTLTQAQVERGLAKQKKKPAKKKGEVVPAGFHVVKDTKPRKKKNNYSRASRQQAEMYAVLGAATAAAVEVFGFRNLDWSDRIPWQLRRYSGLAMAALGWGLGQMKGIKGNMRAFYQGFMIGGAFLAVSDELVRTRKEQTISEAKKFVEEALKAVDGLGNLPAPRRMTAGQAMSNMGQQTRVPFHPHGMGEMVWDDAGLGSIVDLPYSVTRNPNEMGLGGMGLGEMVETSGGWADGQIAFSTDQDDIWGVY